MENKTELGHLYGSRISKNGKWLNLSIVTNFNGQNIYITCPVRISEDEDDNGNGNPCASLIMAQKANGERYAESASIDNIPVYADTKKKKEETPQQADDLPF